jgi:UDP-N-acetylglucosamine 2-epimerase (hydrolysing)
VISPPSRDARRKTVLFLTGTRADFGKLKPLIAEVEADPGLESRLFVTGMHMLARYGFTMEEIQRAGFKNIFSYINQIETGNAQMDLVLANTIQGLGYYVREWAPDVIVVHGDRVEALAGAIVGALNGILVAHIEGGERSGTVDELIRHAVSKLSHLHFVANEEAENRLLQMGEPAESVFVVGSPDIDVMLSDRLPTLDETRARYAINFAEYSIFIHHPVTTELAHLRQQIVEVVKGLHASQRKFVVIYPNNDTGSDVILEHLMPLEANENFRLLPSLRFEHFLTLLKHAQAIVGNSSAGIREAPVYGVPTINIGTRQLNRFMSPSIINVPESSEAIANALRTLPEFVAPSMHFGKGDSARLFVERLRDPAFWETPRQKQFQDVAFALGTANRA